MLSYFNQTSFVHALAVAIVIHSAALVYLKNVSIISPQKIALYSPPKVDILEVTLISVPAQKSVTQKYDAPSLNKPSVSVSPIVKKNSPTALKAQVRPLKLIGQAGNFVRHKLKVSKTQAIMKDPQNLIKKTDSLRLDRVDKPIKLVQTSTTEVIKSVAPITIASPPAKEHLSFETNPKVALSTNHSLAQVALVTQQSGTRIADNPSSTTTELPPLLKSRQPDYPEEARWEERTGKAILKFKISGQGLVLEPHIAKSSGHRDLDFAAVQALQQWRFDYQKSQTSHQWFQYSFRFELN